MTQSFDALYAPSAMSLDELFAAIEPPPLLPVGYEPSDNGASLPASLASRANTPQPIPPDRLWAGVQPAPLNAGNYSGALGDPDTGALNRARASNEALGSIHNDDLLNHILARQAAGLPTLARNYGPPAPIVHDRLWAGVSPTSLGTLNYPELQNSELPGSHAPLNQYADITLNDFPNAVRGFGHVGIGVNTDKTQGFYPRDDNIWTTIQELLGADVPGAVKYDDLSQPHRAVTIHTNSTQDAAVQRYIDATKANPRSYNLYRRNCAGFCEGGLKAGGARTPATGFPNALYDILNAAKPLDLPPGGF